ncbi:MAG TPA: ribonuclease III [Terriglobales bacterium]|jgi:ribonuclease-3
MKFRDITALEQTLGYHFARPELLTQALTHSSQAREQEASSPGVASVADNEQLEFLGDAVLGFVAGEELFRRFPHFHEGQLSKLRAHLVSERHLVRVAQQLQVGDYLRLGRGEEKSGGRQKTALLVDALEAVLAALYLDGGIPPVRQVILDHILAPELEHLARNGNSLPMSDYKSALQEKLQAMGLPQPSYVLVKEQGPEHQKVFTVEVRLQTPSSAGKAQFVGRADGFTKKNAEQDAARQVLEYLCAMPGEAVSSSV